MSAYICITCGVQYPDSDTPPENCPVCDDERQYVNAKGQQWTTLADLQQTHHNNFSAVEANMVRISTEPRVAIGQTPYLISTDEGNILWECNSYIDDATIAEIQARGGLKAIAISHPHFYDAMVEWSQAFGGIPIYLHEANREWAMRPDENIHFWEGETFDLGVGLTIIRVGGHFEGSSVLHWANGAEGKGALLTGDSIMVAPDLKHVSFMYSYPNNIPLSPSKVRHIVSAVEPYSYDRIYSSWVGQVIDSHAKHSVNISADRYIRYITD